ncbi:hypothetical protein AVEN_217601-1 [Araneus ventricosus]|uniref:Uncharacterized protein n=1 Tax=Araneus ventricosus TaxID=182803 RepID=A0A4Y2FK76_ARAVE|nr:hypothetical protein AVEN_217601-1 [Araneus ventricosus]
MNVDYKRLGNDLTAIFVIAFADASPGLGNEPEEEEEQMKIVKMVQESYISTRSQPSQSFLPLEPLVILYTISRHMTVVQGSSQNNPRVAAKRDINITKTKLLAVNYDIHDTENRSTCFRVQTVEPIVTKIGTYSRTPLIRTRANPEPSVIRTVHGE